MGHEEPRRALRVTSLTIPLAILEMDAVRGAAARCNLPVAVWARAVLMKSLTINPVEL